MPIEFASQKRNDGQLTFKNLLNWTTGARNNGGWPMHTTDASRQYQGTVPGTINSLIRVVWEIGTLDYSSLFVV